MDAIGGLLIIFTICYFLSFAVKVAVATKNPAAYEAMERIEDRRQERNRQIAAGAAKGAAKAAFFVAKTLLKK
jgi:hypothetical protein